MATPQKKATNFIDSINRLQYWTLYNVKSRNELLIEDLEVKRFHMKQPTNITNDRLFVLTKLPMPTLNVRNKEIQPKIGI